MMTKYFLLALVSQLYFCKYVSTACGRPPEINNGNVMSGKTVYEPGEEAAYFCRPGYIGQGFNKLVCPKRGVWERPRIKCVPRSCHVPKLLENGEMHATELTFGKQVYYSCNAGYILRGLNHSTCLHDGTWSDQHQFCEPVQCPPPNPPENGSVRFQTTGQPTKVSVFGDMISYECKERLALIGNETGFCLANGKWTNAPQCKEVKCGMPPKIVNGFMVFAIKRSYNYRETIDYGCVENYILDGLKTITCEKTGNWTEKPTCRAPCILPVQRARIFYNGKKIWMNELPKRRILHKERVYFYCKDKERNCGLPVPTQCIDSKIEIPSCFKEPSKFAYAITYGSLPSEIKQC
ncbi:beta-2-glycoprotein 1-like [Rhincodon typus]|uniref:beta-2-glycoprotein 1-like n=1 Tax=Rhincodon typus TaxID=259920 RepID=UPI00203035A3|nr:beta-2-glycoprotein 1-like [Rhincodon typus]